MPAPVKLLYFAWVREKVGLAHETVELPDNVTTVADLMAWMKTRSPAYEAAFAQSHVIRCAINQTHAKPDATLDGAREIAFFPPVTGG